MTNNITYDYECIRCNNKGMKQIPQHWNKDVIYDFYPNFFFCLECGYHAYISQEDKRAA